MVEALVRTMHCQPKNADSILEEAKAGKKQGSLVQERGPLDFLTESRTVRQHSSIWCIVMTALGHHNSSPWGFVLSSYSPGKAIFIDSNKLNPLAEVVNRARGEEESLEGRVDEALLGPCDASLG